MHRRWLRVMGTTVGSTAVASAASLAASTILLRVLPTEDAGAFALLSTLVQTIILIGGLGQSSLIIRLYSQQPLGHYNWRHDLSLVTLVTFPAILALSLIMIRVYVLDMLPATYLLLAGLAGSLILCAGQMLNSQRHYQWGNVLLRLPNSLMLLPAAAIFVLLPLRRLDITLSTQIVTYLLTIGISLLLLWRRTRRGSAVIRARQLGQGLIFVASVSSTVIADQVLLSAAGFSVTAGDLAAFAALSLLFNPVQLLQNVFSKVLITEFAREKSVNYRRIVVQLGVVCLVLVTAATLVLPPIARWLYAGRYDSAFFLIIWLGLANGLDLAEVIPRSYIFGVAPTRVLNRFILAQVIIAVIGLAAGIALIVQYGILGVAVGAALIFVLRLVISYGFFLRSLSAK